MMILNTLKTAGIASALIFGTVGGVGFVANPVQAEPLSQLFTQNLIASGTFMTVQQNKATEGTARIVMENGKRYLEFDGGFTTAQGPDVQIILHRNSSIPVNVNEADYVTLAQLKSFDGAQRYELPANINPSDFQSVGIWCRKFNVTFGYAAF